MKLLDLLFNVNSLDSNRGESNIQQYMNYLKCQYSCIHLNVSFKLEISCFTKEKKMMMNTSDY